MGGWVCEEEARLAARELHAMDVTEGETRVGVTGGGSVQGGSRGRVGGVAGSRGVQGPEPPGWQTDEGTARWSERGGGVWVGGWVGVGGGGRRRALMNFTP